MQDQRAIELSLANLPARRRALFTILAVALGLRLLHLWSVLPVELGQPPEVGMDRWLNTHIAEAVTGRKWLGGWSAAYDSSPGYSYLLAALYWFSGRNWLGPLLVQSLLGACAPLCLYALGRRLFSVSVGIVAATFAALFSPTIFYEALLVKFAFVPITVACALLCLVRALEPGADASAVGAGLTLGVLALLRPNGGIVAPTMLLWLAVSRRRHGFPDIRRPLLLVAAGMAMVMVPMLIRDRIAAAHGLESSLWGIHFYIGTNPDADGTYVSVPGVREDILGHVDDARQVAENASGHALTPSEVSAFWFHRGLSFISAQPGTYIILQGKKLWHAFEADESGSFGDDFHEMRRVSPVLQAPLLTFGVIGPLGLLGLAASAGLDGSPLFARRSADQGEAYSFLRLGGREIEGLTTTTWKVVHNISNPGQPPFEVYDLTRDPLERSSLATARDVRLNYSKVRFPDLGASLRPAGPSVDPVKLERLQALGYVSH